ncbi:loricrin-like [Mustela putorius furo]|uniref:Loricrin-like n=1 Tax=Mustela putorius furo TaxID=9669 RepID=A0A8U0S1R6_MUSPF|nr:loricrin-like [Mustela putorius furo]
MGADTAGGADGGGGGSGGGGSGSVRGEGGLGGGSSDAADSGFEVAKGRSCTSGFGSEGLLGSSGGRSGISVGVGGDSSGSGSGFSGGTSGVGGGADDFSGGTSNGSDDGVNGRCKQHWRRQLGCTSGDRLGVQGSSGGDGGGGSSGGAHSGVGADCVGCTSGVGDSSGSCGADGSNADGSGGAAAGAVQVAAAGARGPATEEGQSYGHGHGHSRFSEGNEHQAKQQLVLSLPDPFCLGPHGIEVLWKLLILTAFLGTCAFLIYLWRTILAIKPRQYEVTLDQIKMKINNLKNENRDLEKNIASWEEKAREAKKQAETKREHKRSLAGVRKLKAQDALADQELRALTSKNQELKERKTFLEDQCNALSSKEAELNLLKKKLDMVVEFSENRKLTAEEKLEEKLYELNAN